MADTAWGAPVLPDLPEESAVVLTREQRSLLVHLLRTRGPVTVGPSERWDYRVLVRLMEGDAVGVSV